MADNENTILTEEESTRIINLSEAAEMDAGMYFVTDSSSGTRKVPITKLIDSDLEDEYAAAPAKAVGDLKEELEHISGVPTEVRDAMYTLLSNAAYVTTGLEDELEVIQEWATEITAITLSQTSVTTSSTVQITATTTPAGGVVTWASSDSSIATVTNGYITAVSNGQCVVTASSGNVTASCSVTVSGIVTLTSITATYTQSGTVYDTDSLDSLKSDLVVVANYSDSSSITLSDSDYTLSGTLEVGTSVITVSYSGKTTTFNVTVTEPIILTGYTEIGSPTITGNILTVGDGKYITCNQPFVPSDEPWEVICKYQRTETFGSYTDVIGSVDSTGASIRGFLLEYSNGTGTIGAVYCSSNGTSWDITSGQTVDTIPDALNTWVWASVAFTGTAYVFKTSTDGETWTTQKTISSTTPIYDETGASVGFGLKRSGWIRGKIDLTGCMIYKNGNLWWKAV